MDRATFARLVAGGAASLPLVAHARELEGTITTQTALFASLPAIAPRQYCRIILGSGAKYQKQIGAGVETDPKLGRLLYLETQVGSPGGNCNPSSMRKSYLRGDRFGSLLDAYALRANIGRVENMFYRFGDLADAPHRETADNTLRLLDERYLYDDRPMRIVSVSTERIHVASRNVSATKVVGEFAKPKGPHERLERIELWHEPSFPFGFARYRATLRDLDPFEAHTYSTGHDFKTMLAYTLDRARSLTRDGQYGQLPESVGA